MLARADGGELGEAVGVDNVAISRDVDPDAVQLGLPGLLHLVPPGRRGATVAVRATVGTILIVHLLVLLMIEAVGLAVPVAFGVDRGQDLLGVQSRGKQSRHDHEDDGEGCAEGPTALLVVEQVELVGALKVTKAFVFHFSLQGVRETSPRTSGA